MTELFLDKVERWVHRFGETDWDEVQTTIHSFAFKTFLLSSVVELYGKFDAWPKEEADFYKENVTPIRVLAMNTFLAIGAIDIAQDLIDRHIVLALTDTGTFNKLVLWTATYWLADF